MKDFNFKSIIPHIVAVGLFLALSLVFFAPELQNKQLKQSDITKHKGISKEIVDYREDSGEQVLWTNALFGGMPSYLVSVQYPNGIVKTIDKVLMLGMKGGKGLMFLYMIGFYVLLLVLRVDPWLGILGAVAFGFSTYHVIILPAGHNAKAHVIGYLPVIFAGFLLLFKHKKYLLGTAVSAVSIALAMSANHPQMVYYLFMILMVVGIFFFIDSIKEKAVPAFLKSAGLFVLALLLGFGTSASRLLTVAEYGKSSTRGGTELVDNQNPSNMTDGLDRDYITGWSYGIAESFSLLVPNFYGGQSKVIGDEKDAMKNASRENRASISQSVSAYWGDQPYVAGPVYAGAGICFLALIGFWLLKGTYRYALLASLILMLVLSWGKNFAVLTDLFIDYFPAYNKFRSVNSMMVGVILLLPLVAVLGVDRFIKNREEVKSNMKMFYIISGSVMGLLALMMIMPSLFTSFFATGESDRLFAQLSEMKLPATRIQGFLDDILAVRKSIFSADVMRSMLVVGAMIVALYLFLKEIIKKEILIALLVLITVADLWQVDRRYLNDDNFVTKRKNEIPFKIAPAEKEILNDKELGFRVFSLSSRLDSDARTSYFFRSLGGYHGAKMGRYQDLISKHLTQPINPAVVNMLNVKYLTQGAGAQTQVQVNPDALGTSWFVDNIKVVDDANAEIESLTDLDPKATALVDKRFSSDIEDLTLIRSESDVIRMTKYHPTSLTYESNTAQDGFAVFSEIYYQPGWNAYIDGQLTDHVRVNYVLRGMKIPAGNHQIEFKFEPKSYSMGNKISMASSILLILLILGTIYFDFKGRLEKDNSN